jgi:hypothetical protein
LGAVALLLQLDSTLVLARAAVPNAAPLIKLFLEIWVCFFLALILLLLSFLDTIVPTFGIKKPTTYNHLVLAIPPLKLSIDDLV